ncbi:MATE family efflux transporter [Gluconacetobacter tumulisoli]|uniref:MATE family efflux transporter n=1 Tax=Gluconacetobacter tumulisoli TaxID=1286189 RepID=A0A7W4PNC3_9PROT|nr:MATE family efflux transporter [Gluconacetobacter tumulisoli]MBB2200741.1 MATE family efflux transporter [Gluconacetobacter tumulisoli]
MRDLTQGSIPRLLAGMAGFIGFGLIVQTLYLLVDLYFVARLGGPAVAGVAAAGSVMLFVMALSQAVSVGALSLIARAIGARDAAGAQTVFEQAIGMAMVAGAATLLAGYPAGGSLMTVLSADDRTAMAARAYLFALLPSLALMFPGAALGAALRAAGIVGAPMAIQSATVLLNAALAPVLVAGWGTGHPFGVAGAGFASSGAAAIGTVAQVVLFGRLDTTLQLRAAAPRLATWRRIAATGLPASGEFLLMFVISGVVYWALRRYGSDAQAGFGIGSRVMQSIFLPAMAVAFAAAPIAAQNHGAGRADRVRATFRATALTGSGIMLALTFLCRLHPDLLVRVFTGNPTVAAVASDYLRVVSWNFVAMGLVFSCSAMFQGFGNTGPALAGTASRLVTFVLPVILLAHWPQATLHDIWRLSNASVVLQASVSLLLLRRAFRRHLGTPVSGRGHVTESIG